MILDWICVHDHEYSANMPVQPVCVAWKTTNHLNFMGMGLGEELHVSTNFHCLYCTLNYISRVPDQNGVSQT